MAKRKTGWEKPWKGIIFFPRPTAKGWGSTFKKFHRQTLIKRERDQGEGWSAARRLTTVHPELGKQAEHYHWPLDGGKRVSGERDGLSGTNGGAGKPGATRQRKGQRVTPFSRKKQWNLKTPLL